MYPAAGNGADTAGSWSSQGAFRAQRLSPAGTAHTGGYPGARRLRGGRCRIADMVGPTRLPAFTRYAVGELENRNDEAVAEFNATYAAGIAGS